MQCILCILVVVLYVLYCIFFILCFICICVHAYCLMHQFLCVLFCGSCSMHSLFEMLFYSQCLVYLVLCITFNASYSIHCKILASSHLHSVFLLLSSIFAIWSETSKFANIGTLSTNFEGRPSVHILHNFQPWVDCIIYWIVHPQSGPECKV